MWLLPVSTWILPGYYLVTSWLLPGYCLVPAFLLSGYFLITAWLLLGSYLVTFCLLRGYCPFTTCRLSRWISADPDNVHDMYGLPLPDRLTPQQNEVRLFLPPLTTVSQSVTALPVLFVQPNPTPHTTQYTACTVISQ